MNGALKRANLFLLVASLCILSLIAAGCEDPGSVGKSLGDSNTEVVMDSVSVGEILPDSTVAFSGAKPNFSAGIFEDPLFGKIKATALIKPALLSFDGEIAPTSPMKLRLVMKPDSVYGDTLGQMEFSLFRINELWRGKSWKLNNDVPFIENIPGSPFTSEIGSFSVTKEDSIDIDLVQGWASQYIQLYNDRSGDRDSLYTNNFFGLAIVPQNEARIIPFSPGRSKFIIEEVEDSTFVNIPQSAFSLERSNAQPSPPGTKKVVSTLEDFVGFDMNISTESLGIAKISRAEFIFYVDVERLDESIRQNTISSIRPRSTRAKLHLIRRGDIPEALDPGRPISTGTFQEADSAYHFEVTNFVRSVINGGLPPGNRFFVTLQNNTGIIFSSLLFDSTAQARKQPELVITSIKAEGL